MTIGVLSAMEDFDFDTALEEEIEFFLEPGVDSGRNFKLQGDFQYSYTNDYWYLVPELESECDNDPDRVWQQIIWEFEGEFEIEKAEVLEEAIQSIGWELSLGHDYHEVGLDENYWRIVSVEEI